MRLFIQRPGRSPPTRPHPPAKAGGWDRSWDPGLFGGEHVPNAYPWAHRNPLCLTTRPLICSCQPAFSYASANSPIIPIQRTQKGGDIKNMALKGAHLGSCIVTVEENTTAGAPPSSFPHLPQICPLQGRSVDFNLIYSSARRPAADRVGPLPRPANTAVGRMGLKVTGVFLCLRPLTSSPERISGRPLL